MSLSIYIHVEICCSLHLYRTLMIYLVYFSFFSTVKERGVVKIKGYDSNTVTILGRNEGKSHLT